ncbi:MAG: inorganic phosphate transporter [Deltaproteobacteria bacterium]
MDLYIIGLAAAIGLYMAWNIGANDVANSMADAVGSKSITIKQAVIAAGICEFSGAVLVGSHVTETVRKGIVNPAAISSLPGLQQGDAATLIILGMTAALLSAAFWLHFSTKIGMPVSTTHSIVGAIAGFGIVAAGWHSVNWGKMGQIVASWFISPVAGGLMAYLIFQFISKFILGRQKPARAAITFTPIIVFVLFFAVVLATIFKGLKNVIGSVPWLTEEVSFCIALAIGLLAAIIYKMLLRRKLENKSKLPLAEQLELIEEMYAPLVVISSCSVAFAHGANDVANAVGPLAAIVNILEHGSVAMKVGIPFWILAIGGAGIVFGLATYGYKVMHTVGTEITEITPSRGVAADIAATVTVLACTRMKLPISTTHTLVGAILGIGLARGLSGINSQITKKIFGSWLLTVPAAAIVAILIFLVERHYLFEFVKSLVLQAGTI